MPKVYKLAEVTQIKYYLTLTRSNSSTSPYQALLCPKIIINKLIGRAANCTIYILVSYLYQILCNFIFFCKHISSTLKAVLPWTDLLWKSLLRGWKIGWITPVQTQTTGRKIKACLWTVTAILPPNPLIDKWQYRHSLIYTLMWAGSENTVVNENRSNHFLSKGRKIS